MIQDRTDAPHFTLIGIRIVGYLFLFITVACQPNTLKKFEQAKPLLQDGDIIFRNGKDAVSEAARGFNRKDKSYSHCGIIQIENDSVFVYHAIGGVYNPSQKLLRQTLEAFCNPEEVDKVAVYRYKLNLVQQKFLKNIIDEYYSSGLPFDMFFNFSTDDKMYCSEFVYKSLNRAMDNTLKKHLHNLALPLYVSIDDLYLNGTAQMVTKFRF
ncbi:MAG TPA: YiiX/YebB-like N1pC/P60 family cysteine hydrolase [Niabella sp.]|nr:YiiX/YebB-like N1pC/P60 family cysteine hydrolase [Niabella sp.]HQW14086.1 YiiX/YebB-like N1pC/P60 family cysteine hydrolase [Niabella sp.]HQX19371.1 YiiX/YebB-like N1pC/P60 family cysteine hydrolase [Niabella sp.]HQX40276.1 YiiX/YebB-like N1pC/P60 family cysteine hydrolase [Niabella sp.]HRB05588.1 YiiX/YebB-like N1pC/P60 family cysteine hydrolase [Niabella sp.]